VHLVEADPAARLHDRASVADQVDQQSASDDRRDRLDPELTKAESRVDAVCWNSSVQRQVLCLVAESVDVRARVLACHQDSGRTRAPLRVVALMPAMQQVGVARRHVGGMDRGGCAPWLLQVEDAKGVEIRQ
jgi:hypothetical protein